MFDNPVSIPRLRAMLSWSANFNPIKEDSTPLIRKNQNVFDLEIFGNTLNILNPRKSILWQK